MVINFKAREISWSARKLAARILTLINKKKNSSVFPDYHYEFFLLFVVFFCWNRFIAYRTIANNIDFSLLYDVGLL